MRRFVALVAAVTFVVVSADPASAGWRRCGCRGQFIGQRWSGGYVNGQAYANCNGNGYQAQQTVTAGYPPADGSASIQADGTYGATSTDIQVDAPRPVGQPQQVPQPPNAPQPAAPQPNQ